MSTIIAKPEQYSTDDLLRAIELRMAQERTLKNQVELSILQEEAFERNLAIPPACCAV